MPRSTKQDSRRVVAAHQPTFLPWLGWFDKAARSDVFIVLDDVQWPREGAGNWMNRVRVLVGGEPQWITAPVRHRGLQRVDEVEFDETRPWRDRILRTLAQSYTRARGYTDAFPVVERLVRNDERRVVAYNEVNVERLLGLLQIETELRYSSTLAVDATGTERLLALTHAVGGDVYVSGDGSAGYLEPERFADSGIELRYQEFVHPHYEQFRHGFTPGLSVVDALLHCGVDGVHALLQR